LENFRNWERSENWKTRMHTQISKTLSVWTLCEIGAEMCNAERILIVAKEIYLKKINAYKAALWRIQQEYCESVMKLATATSFQDIPILAYSYFL
jgi:hypothetical protein